MGSLRLGPLNLPVWLLGSLAGLLVLTAVRWLVLRASRDQWRVADEILTNAALIGFAVWKLTPLVTRSAEIVEAPVRLLFYPGGRIGAIGGIIAGAAALLVAVIRRRRREPIGLPHLIHGLTLAAALAMAPLVSAVAETGDVYDLTQADFSFLSEPHRFDPSAPTALVFWATWCAPCTAQMPELDRFFDEYGDTGINLIAVNLVETEVGVDAVRSYLSGGGYELPVALDHRSELWRRFEAGATPTTIVLDRTGRERSRRTGAISVTNLARRLLPLSE